MKPDFDSLLNDAKEMEAHLLAEISNDLILGYTARAILRERFDALKLMGHETPFERIGEILNEFEHVLEYTDTNVGRLFYQDLIDNVIWYCERDRRAFPGIFTYPNILLEKK